MDPGDWPEDETPSIPEEALPSAKAEAPDAGLQAAQKGQGTDEGLADGRQDPTAAPEGSDSPTVQFCWAVGRQLSDPDTSLPADDRCRLVNAALGKILLDIHVPEQAVAGIATKIQSLAPAQYGRWVDRAMRQGLFLDTVIRPAPARHAAKVVEIIRPHLLDELTLKSCHEVALLDSALAAYMHYVTLTVEVKYRERGFDQRPGKVVAQDARIVSSAMACLKQFSQAIADLRRRPDRQARVVIAHAEGDIALQVNDAGGQPTQVAAEG
ncbi:MAG: hypothetical protein WBF17_17075 [Phycisphaerae bacterium]